MKWKKILFVCLSLVFVFYISTPVGAETYTPVQISGYKANDGKTIVKDEDGKLYIDNGNGKISKIPTWSYNPNGSSGNPKDTRNYSVLNTQNGNVYIWHTGGNSYQTENSRDLLGFNQYDYEQINRQYTQEQGLKSSINNAKNNPNSKATPEQITEAEKTLANQQPPQQNNDSFNISSCGSYRNWFPIDCWAAWVLNNIVLGSVYLLTGVAGFLFDSVLKFSVINMGANVQIGQGSYLGNAWGIMRDVVNIAFIFVLLYVGIMTIIKGFESGTSKMIATVIVVALIINFSLFFTKIIIDTSNIIAINFYESIKSQTAASNSNWSGIAGVFFEKLRISTINSAIADQASGNMYLNIIKISLGGIIIMFILGIVLLIASAMFIARYIILVFVLVASAVAIGSWIIPSLKKSIYDKWWAALIGQSFFAPVFLFFIYISLEMTSGLTKSLLDGGGNIDWANLFLARDISSVINLLIMYLVVIGFLIGSIIVSKSLSDMAGKGAGQITGIVGGGALGLAGMAGRNTLGRASRRLADSTMVNNFAANSAIGRGLRSTLKAGAKSSFDLRASSKASKIIGATGVDLGKAGGKGGYQETLEKQIKAREGYYKEIGETTQGEKLRKDALQSKIDNLEETQKRQKLIKEIKEGEEELKLLKEGSDAHTKTKEAIDKKKVEAAELKTEIENKSKTWKDEIKEIDSAGKTRSSAYAESFDKIIPKIPFTDKSIGKLWVGQKNKLAAVNLRNAKRKNQTDSEKILGALKDLKKSN